MSGVEKGRNPEYRSRENYAYQVSKLARKMVREDSADREFLKTCYANGGVDPSGHPVYGVKKDLEQAAQQRKDKLNEMIGDNEQLRAISERAQEIEKKKHEEDEFVNIGYAYGGIDPIGGSIKHSVEHFDKLRAERDAELNEMIEKYAQSV